MEDANNSSKSKHEVPQAVILVIFGASGDLSRRKLMPALYHLSREGLLPPKFLVLGLGRRIQIGPEFVHHMQMRVRQYCSHKMEDIYWNPLASSMDALRANYQDPAY